MTEPVQHELVTEITVRMTVRSPFDAEHYPDMTLEEALEFERSLDPAEIAMLVTEHLSSDEGASISWTVTAEEVSPSDG